MSSRIQFSSKKQLGAESFVTLHNKNDQKSWTAKIYPWLSNTTLKQLSYRKLPHEYFLHKPGLPYSIQKAAVTAFVQTHAKLISDTALDVSDLPKNFNWPSDNVVIDQGNCGSCYAISALYVLASRTRIALQKLGIDYSPNLSVQSVISCSWFNQGCEGGYPFLVGKWATEAGIPESKCMSYMGADREKCRVQPGSFIEEARESDPCQQMFFASNYGYIGGYFGGANEEKIMRDIKKFGPVVMAIDAPDSLYYYSDGVYDELGSEAHKHHKHKDLLPNVNGWEYTDHAVAATGWGEDEDSHGLHFGLDGVQLEKAPCKKYWIIRNSWGEKWGENGYVRLCRGEDLGGVESQAIWITPDLTRGHPKTLVEKMQSKSNDVASEKLINNTGSRISERIARNRVRG